MDYPLTLFGFGPPEIAAIIMIGIVAAIIHVTTSAFRKGYYGDNKDKK